MDIQNINLDIQNINLDIQNTNLDIQTLTPFPTLKLWTFKTPSLSLQSLTKRSTNPPLLVQSTATQPSKLDS